MDRIDTNAEKFLRITKKDPVRETMEGEVAAVAK